MTSDKYHIKPILILSLLCSFTTASANTYYFSSSNGTGANNKTAFGYQGLYNPTTGIKNISIGSYSTSANANLTTGSNNIIIGNDVQALSVTASNQLNIGNLIFGTGVSGTGTTIVGNIGIGTNAPATMLDMNGQITFKNSRYNPNSCKWTMCVMVRWNKFESY